MSNFSAQEVGLATALATIIEVGLLALLIVAGTGKASIDAKEAPPPPPIPIAVKPVLDDTPLLKLGGKRIKTKLPDMWVKRPPVKRYEAKSAPSPKADKTKEGITETPVAERDAKAPPPDAEIAKQVDDDIPDTDAAPQEKPNVDEEGSPDGVKEGTETDPLKARAVSLYRMRIISWFNARFRVPSELSCEELAPLSAAVAAQIGPGRTVTGYTLSRPSGNPVFDARVRSTMDSIVSGGQELPPPPPNYPDILDSTVFPTFLGKGHQCD